MKHKIVASSYSAFSALFDGLVDRLKQTDQEIVKAQFSWDNDLHKGFWAKVWTREGAAS